MMPGDPLTDYSFTVQILSCAGERPALDADIVAEKQLSFDSLVEGHNTLADKVSNDSMFSGGALPYDYHLRIKDLPTWSIGSNA